MKPLDPELVKSLAVALQLTITTHEVDKAYRRLSRRWGYKGLYHWFDCAADWSGDWRWCLTGILAKRGAMITISLNTKTVESVAPIVDLLADQMSRAAELLARYDEAREIAKRMGEEVIKGKLKDLMCEVEDTIEYLEAFDRQIEDMGIGEWLGQKLRHAKFKVRKR